MPKVAEYIFGTRKPCYCPRCSGANIRLLPNNERVCENCGHEFIQSVEPDDLLSNQDRLDEILSNEDIPVTNKSGDVIGRVERTTDNGIVVSIEDSDTIAKMNDGLTAVSIGCTEDKND